MDNVKVFEIVKTMIEQFGGNRSMAMIGGSPSIYGTNKGNQNVPCGNDGDVYVDIRFKAKSAKVNGKSPNGIRIVYNVSQDMYTMVFFRVHGTNVSVLDELSSVFADNLKEIFEDYTKLALSL